MGEPVVFQPVVMAVLTLLLAGEPERGLALAREVGVDDTILGLAALLGGINDAFSDMTGRNMIEQMALGIQKAVT